MRLKEYEIVIEPREIVFEHIKTNKSFTRTLNIKNVGNKSKRMELFRPSNKVFKLKHKNPELPVPPGMEIAAVIEFETESLQEYKDKMVVSIDNKEIEIPIRAFPAKPTLQVEKIVDFGVQSASNKTISQKLKISNVGAVAGEFSINYKGKLPLTFVPTREVVPPFSETIVRVDFFTSIADQIQEKVKIRLEGSGLPHNEDEFIVKANVMERKVQLLDCQTQEPIKRVDFGSCYYGCNLSNLAIIYNSSPETVDYVILLEQNGLGAEVGAELSKSTNALKANDQVYKEEDFCPLDKLITAFPNNGTLKPFEKRPIFFRFCPEFVDPRSGFITTLKPPPRRDYAIFLYIDLLGHHQRSEVAITGTALPVLLRIEPNKMEFGPCQIGQKKEINAILYNDSELKYVKFKFRKVANFIVNPASGQIAPRSSKKVIVSFVPHQNGCLSYPLNCEVIDKIADKDNPLLVTNQRICDVPIQVSGEGVEITKMPDPKYSGGIEPILTNEVGVNVNTTMATMKPFQPKAAVQNATKDHLHQVSYAERISSSNKADFKVAFPNDRAKSIGPFNRYEKYKTIFTKADRYNYIDPDYAYTEEERKQIEMHKQIYKNYIDDLKFNRTEIRRTREYKAFNDPVDNDLIPYGKIKEPRLTLDDMALEASKPPNFQVNPDWKLVTTEELAKQEKKFKSMPVQETLALGKSKSSVGLRDREKVSSQLTPAQIYKIIVNPPVIDFGEVAVRSISTKNLEIYNTLDQPIHIELENDCNELRRTSPIGQIIKAQSKGVFPIIFESEFVQNFQRSISYRINYSYRHHIIILAESKLQSLKLSKNHLVITQIPGLQPELCYRANITIINQYNTVAEFTWVPIYGDQGTAFSIRPASGVVEPNTDLECEVVWHGSYQAPITGTFSLQVTGGESTTLTCEAVLGSTQLQFINRRANFGKIPVNMTSKKIFYMTNTSSQHAFFQIHDTKPIPGMVITPAYGIAPVSGLTPIKVEMTPSEIIKFDARVMIQIRGGKMLELRLGGESEEPNIDIDVPTFNFGGIFSGAACAIPFKLSNKGTVKGKINFNLRKFADFSIRSPDKSLDLIENDRKYEITVLPQQAVDLELMFSPTEVASYDFDLPMEVNKQNDEWAALFDRNPSGTPYQSEPMGGSSIRDKTPVGNRNIHNSSSNNMSKRKVTAVGLRHALEISHSKIEFKIPLLYLERLRDGGFFEAKSTLMTNQSHRKVKWCIDMRKANRILDEGKFKICDGSMIPFINRDQKSFGPEGELQPFESVELKILFCPDKPGVFSCTLPIVINDNFDQPYYHIEIRGELLTPEIYFEPEMVILKQVPLGMEVIDKFFIKHRGYENNSKIRLQVPETRALDGSVVKALSVAFKDEPVIEAHNLNQLIEVQVRFQSSKPISTTAKLSFSDDHNNEFYLNVVFAADNSIFTCYGFLADHQTDYQIVLQEGQIMKGSRNNRLSLPSEVSGDPILRPCTGTSKMSGRRTVSPTFDMNRALSRESEVDDGIRAGMNTNQSNYSGVGSQITAMTSTKAQEALLFPSHESSAGVYSYEILKILQRWFKTNGWPTCHNPVKIPDSFRGGVSRKPLDEGQENMPQQDAMKRETHTIYEMIANLCGRQLPAIPITAPVPVDLVERTFQFRWQHNVLLKFIETEGGCVAHIKPDHLLDMAEFKSWNEQNRKQKRLEEADGFKDTKRNYVDSVEIPEGLFQLVSKKAWLDTLLQILKVCVLNSITVKSFKSAVVPFNKEATFPDVKLDPLTSNIYSTGERILLAWLNYCYTNYKDAIWADNDKGSAPTSRWIVNFDIDLTDSLALAAVIGAYCPFMIESHLKRMYLQADTAEKCFHNALILIECCRKLGLDYDINSLDITDPNPIGMCLFCAFLYQKMPSYIPNATIEFNSPLHQTCSKQIKVVNPSNKNIVYQAILLGPSSENFTLPKGAHIQIQPKGKLNLAVDFIGNSLKPINTHLILVGRKQSSIAADTLVFNLKANIDELTAKKVVKFQSPLYKPKEIYIEIENPHAEAGEFKVTILESSSKSGMIKNPFNHEASSESAPSPSLKSSKDSPKKADFHLNDSKAMSHTDACTIDGASSGGDASYLSAFHTRTTKLSLKAKEKMKVLVTYLPLQYVKHSGILLFTNERLGQFLYYLDGLPSPPEPSKVTVDESGLDSSRIKVIKSSRPENKTITLRCFAGDKVDIKLRVPVFNLDRENAIIMATEQRMSASELERRKLHGVLSSKSLLESLNNLSVNNSNSKSIHGTASKSSTAKMKTPSETNNDPIEFTVKTKNALNFQVPNKLTVQRSETRSDENYVILNVRFTGDRVGTFSNEIELISLPDDYRVIPIDFKVTESAVSDSSVAYLEFSACVFDSVTQYIPIRNNSEITCNYEVTVDIKNGDKTVFKGPSKFSVRSKDIYSYELVFTPNAEEKFEAELKFYNATEGIQSRYFLTGTGDRRPPLGEIKLETRVGQVTNHEIIIPNKSGKKICFYVSSNSSFINGPDKIMVLPNKRESYSFQVIPKQRGEFRGAVTFRPGEWPIKDIDSDGEEIVTLDSGEKHQKLTLWFTFDFKVFPAAPQSQIELEAHSQDTSTLCIPLSNPLQESIKLSVFKQGPYMEGPDSIEIGPNEKLKYELNFSPKQVGKFRGSLIFQNEDVGEFWYDLKLTALNALPIRLETMESEVGRFATQTIKLKNPLNEPISFRPIVSNPNNFALERRQNEPIKVEANGTTDVNVIFTPSAIGLSDHYALVSFYNERIGEISYDLRGVGVEPDVQDPINITSEIGASQMVTINFRNPTESAIYCDLALLNEKGENIIEANQGHIFNILIDSLINLHVSPKATLDIPIIFTPSELKRHEIKLIVTARREARMNWVEDSNTKNPTTKKVEKLKWVYPITAVTVINAFSRSTPFVLECMVRKRLEKRMEIVLSGVTSYASDQDRSSLRLRSVTPFEEGAKPNNAEKEGSESSRRTPYNLVLIGETHHIGKEFVHSLHFSGTAEQNEMAKNSIALKLVRTVRDKQSGLVTLIFDFVFSPSKSFIIDANLQVETAMGGIWRYPLKLNAIESPPDDTITIEAIRLNRESLVGFRLSSKTDEAVPFKASFAPNGDKVFTVSPTSGDLYPEEDEGTLFKVGFIPPAYGKVYQSQLIITTANCQWKYVLRGVTPEYVVPRGQSGLPVPDLGMRRYGKKRNYVVENMYIIQTAVSSPIKGAKLVQMRTYNRP